MAALREKKKAATRRNLERAALALFAERGYDQTTVDEIAAEAGVSRRTYFRYFETKEAVVFAHHDERIARFEALLNARQGDEDRMRTVRRACLSMAAYLMSIREDWFAQQRVIAGSRALTAWDINYEVRWEAAIARALGDTDEAPEDQKLRARLLAGATLGMIRGILRDWFDSHGQTDLVALGERAFELVRLRANPGSPQDRPGPGREVE